MQYEMEWSVRYFLYQSRQWNLGDGNKQSHANADAEGLDGRRDADADVSCCDGAYAYAARKKTMWLHWAKHADRSFSRCNPAYQSPLTL